MRRMIDGCAILCAIAGTFATSVAQISVTETDVNDKLGIGKDLITVNDTLTTSVNIGSPGATSWDFSGLLNHSSTTMTSVAPASTPFIAQFPGTTHVLKTSLAGSFSGIPGTVDGDLYTYLTLGTSFLVNAGSMGSGTITLPGANPLPGELSILNAPPDTTYALPFTFGTRWGSAYTATTIITVAGYQLSNTPRSYITAYLVDAYGPMKMPGGSIHEALRIRKEDRSAATIVSYAFLAKDGATVQVTAADPSFPDSGTIQVARGYVTWTGGPPVSVRDTDPVPVEFSLSDNYPNPFNPTTVISYQLPVSGYVKLVVYDLLGREVATLVDEQKPEGSYTVNFNAGNLSSGMYLYQLKAGGFVATRSMLLLK